MKISEIDNFLEKAKTNNIYRKINSYQNISSTKSIDKFGNIYTCFSSNNYLGLSHNEETIRKVKLVLKFGLGSTGSRLVSGAGFFSENRLKSSKKRIITQPTSAHVCSSKYFFVIPVSRIFKQDYLTKSISAALVRAHNLALPPRAR